MALYLLFKTLHIFIRILYYAVFIYVILTWIAPRSPLCAFFERLTAGIIGPFRGLGREICMRWGSPFDLSCLFAFLALQLADRLLIWLYRVLI